MLCFPKCINMTFLSSGQLHSDISTWKEKMSMVYSTLIPHSSTTGPICPVLRCSLLLVLWCVTGARSQVTRSLFALVKMPPRNNGRYKEICEVFLYFKGLDNSENSGGKGRWEILGKQSWFCFSGKNLCLPYKRQKQADMVRFSLFITIPCPASLKQPCRSSHLDLSKGWMWRLSGTGWKWQIILYSQNSSNSREKFGSLLSWPCITKHILRHMTTTWQSHSHDRALTCSGESLDTARVSLMSIPYFLSFKNSPGGYRPSLVRVNRVLWGMVP